jgi:predicted transcriptional regulator
MAPKSETFPPLELKIMHILWDLRQASVAAVQEKLDPPLAYTTVQTMLNRLATKGKITRQLEGRAYLYRPAVTQAKATGHALRDLIDRIFGGSSEQLVLSLLNTRQIDPKTLAELTRRYNPGETPAPEPSLTASHHAKAGRK